MATRLDGRVVSKKILGELKQTVAKLAQQDVTPTLAVVLVGSDPASEVYVRNKQRRAEEIGVRSLMYRLPEDTSQMTLLAKVAELNQEHIKISPIPVMAATFPVSFFTAG